MTKIKVWTKTKIILTVSLAMVIILGVFYVVQVNALVEATYLRNRHQKTLVDLRQDLEKSELSWSENSSLGKVKGLVEDLDFKRIDRVSYIRVLERVAARR